MRIGNWQVGPVLVLLAALNTGAWLGTQIDAALPRICTAQPRVTSVALDSIGDDVVAIRVMVQPGAALGKPADLARVTIASLSDARLEVEGEPRGVPLDVEFSSPVTAWSFDLRRTRRGSPFGAELTIIDRCGRRSLTVSSADVTTGTGPGDGGSGSGSAPRLPAASAAFSEPGVALGLYRQTFPADLAALDEYERTAGTRMSIVHWYAHWGGWGGRFDREDLERVARRGAIPMITWEPWAGANDPAWSLRNGILSGRNDAYIESWARGLSEFGRPVLLRFAHEMHNQPDYPWVVGSHGNTAEDYLAAWRHVRAIFARFETRNVIWIWNPNVRGATPATELEPIYRSLYPGDDEVDWLGLNVYNTGPGLDWGAPAWRSFDEILAEPYRAITAISGKPVILGEVGSTESGGDKAAWIASAMAPDLPDRFPRLKALVWFDVDKEQPWHLGSSRPVLESFLRAWGQPTFSADAARMFR